MEEVAALRRKVLQKGVSIRQAARELSLSRNTVRRYLREDLVAGVRKQAARASPVKDAVAGPIRGLIADLQGRLGGKQRLTAALLHRVATEAGLRAGATVVKEIYRDWKLERREVFVPLVYRPGELFEVDFFEVLVDLDGVRTKAALFLLRLMHSGTDFVRLYDRQDQVSFLDGHVRAFAHLGGVPSRGLYDNLKPAVAKLLVGSDRVLAQRFLALTAHYAFEACFARPRTGHDKGGVEARGGAIRRQDLTPIPSGSGLAEISCALQARLDASFATATDASGRARVDLLSEDRAHFGLLPPHPFRAAAVRSCVATGSALVKIDCAEYSVPEGWARRDVMAYVEPDRVELVGPDGSRVSHPRQRRGGRVVDYGHYLGELSRKPQAVRQVAPELARDLGEPFEAAWRRLEESHGPKEAARTFAVVLDRIRRDGLGVVAARVAAALASGEPLLIAMRPRPAPPEAGPVPGLFQDVVVERASASVFDELLCGAAP